MRRSQEAALAARSDRLAPVRFLVGGSALAALHGVDIAVGDIDLMGPASSVDDLRRVAGEWWRGRRVGGGHAHLETSWLAGLGVGGEPVEMMGGLAVVVGNERWEMPLRFGGFADVMGRQVPLAAIGPWVVLYALYRPSIVPALLPLLDNPV